MIWSKKGQEASWYCKNNSYCQFLAINQSPTSVMKCRTYWSTASRPKTEALDLKPLTCCRKAMIKAHSLKYNLSKTKAASTTKQIVKAVTKLVKKLIWWQKLNLWSNKRVLRRRSPSKTKRTWSRINHPSNSSNRCKRWIKINKATHRMRTKSSNRMRISVISSSLRPITKRKTSKKSSRMIMLQI